MIFNFTDPRPVVVIYKDKLLPRSQTFVPAQAEALQQYFPLYIGAQEVSEGFVLPKGRWAVVNDGSWLGNVRGAAFYIWGLSPTLVRALRQTRPVLMHCHFGVDGISAMHLARKLRIPLLVTFHGYDATIKSEFAMSRRHRKYLRQRHILAREAATFLAVSNHLKQRLLDQGFPPEKVIVHYIGIDTAVFRANPNVVREPIVLFVGRLVEKKGCEYLIRAMAQVQASYSGARLVIIGDGPLRSQLEQLAPQYCPGTTFLGTRPPYEVREWMNRASVFCVPSVTAKNGDQEGFGLVFAEAQAMSLPVVSFASGGIPEAVSNGKTGFLLPERDEQGLASMIALLLNDPELWNKMSAEGVRRVRSQFDLRTQTALLEKIYASIITAASGPVREQVAEMKMTSWVPVL
jgi:colanic acid/amylovoran biosynthesis glycosyltransferase